MEAVSCEILFSYLLILCF